MQTDKVNFTKQLLGIFMYNTTLCEDHKGFFRTRNYDHTLNKNRERVTW